jgi:hypothetical protein
MTGNYPGACAPFPALRHPNSTAHQDLLLPCRCCLLSRQHLLLERCLQLPRLLRQQAAARIQLRASLLLLRCGSRRCRLQLLQLLLCMCCGGL